MNHTLCLAAVVLLDLFAGSLAGADANISAQKQDEQRLIELEHQWAAAYVAGDPDKLACHF